MRESHFDEDLLPIRLKHFIVDALELNDVEADSITDDEPLVGGRIGLDSLDGVELFLAMEEEFGIMIRDGDESRAALTNVASLTDFIRTHLPRDVVMRQARMAPRIAASR
jgi:acyl carrier protein